MKKNKEYKKKLILDRQTIRHLKILLSSKDLFYIHGGSDSEHGNGNACTIPN